MPSDVFSARFGYKPPVAEISVREDAPEDFRHAVIALAERYGLDPHDMRRGICGVLLVQPNPNNWSAYPNVSHEVGELIEGCPWYRVYEVAEEFYKKLQGRYDESHISFQNRLNEFMLERGVGWEMKDGQFIFRGSEGFTQTLKEAHQLLDKAGQATASSELDEAIKDLSRRPNPDITGAITHAVSSLECCVREISGDSNATLGSLIKNYGEKLGITKPLDIVMEKIWGFASERARHIKEGGRPGHEDAELVVAVCAAFISFLLKKAKQI